MSKPRKPRPYSRCQDCGAKFKGARRRPFCRSCADGQQHLFDPRPVGFIPVVTRGA